ncbi:YigZ family protein [Aliidiomarina minuta]|uniref:YigZ family protein n=1 Tax=Aliidiomarina minuta TaxID=880057 RepID=A0A432W5A6_9GAMM|nr:YigZ family protein [Aliidiomarina minuta]RUO25221.1 YigZ family protein [Aliidiomarina minuta]
MFPVPAQRLSRELVIKKSRFIAWAAPVTSRDEALQLLAEARREYPDAGHHCWAYVIGNPQSATSAAMNDDGEPSGTAGKPILSVMQHKGIGNLVVVVIRYFGGVKLGAGGLVRAYAGATEKVLSELPLKTEQPVTVCILNMDFSLEQLLRHWLHTEGGELQKVDYSESVQLTVAVPNAKLKSLEQFCLGSGIAFQLFADGLNE